MKNSWYPPLLYGAPIFVLREEALEGVGGGGQRGRGRGFLGKHSSLIADVGPWGSRDCGGGHQKLIFFFLK